MLWDRQVLPRGRWFQLPPTPQQRHAGARTHFNIACGAEPAAAFLFPRCDHLSCACSATWLLDMMAAHLACLCSWGGSVPSSFCLEDECLLHSARAWPSSSGPPPHQRPGAGRRRWVTEDGQAAILMWHWGLQLDPVPGGPRFLHFKEKFILGSRETRRVLKVNHFLIPWRVSASDVLAVMRCLSDRQAMKYSQGFLN